MEIANRKADHRDEIGAEKSKYYKHKAKGRRPEPKKHMSVIVDGMDQAKTNSPKPARMSKDTESLFQYGSVVTGVLSHGDTATPAAAYLSDSSLPKDANLVIYILVMMIQLRLAASGIIPEVLYLQLDNCAGENKNRYLLFFCGLLVAWKIFRKVKVSFLPVGHTHEDIDQMFSRFAEWLRNHDIFTVEELAEGLRQSFTAENKPPLVECLSTLPDYKSWMKNVMPHTFQGHSGPMCFKFEGYKNVVRMYVRDHMRTRKAEEPTCWLPQDGYNILTLRQADELLETPIYHVVTRPLPIDDIRRTIEAYEEMDLMNLQQVQQWNNRLNSMSSAFENQCGVCRDLRLREQATNSVTCRLHLAHTTISAFSCTSYQSTRSTYCSFALR